MRRARKNYAAAMPSLPLTYTRFTAEGVKKILVYISMMLIRATQRHETLLSISISHLQPLLLAF